MTANGLRGQQMLPVAETARRLRIAASLDKILSRQRMRLLTFQGSGAFSTGAALFKTCTTCDYYSGLTYGGQRLTCAVHPGGPLECPCPDWHPCGAARRGGGSTQFHYTRSHGR